MNLPHPHSLRDTFRGQSYVVVRDVIPQATCEAWIQQIEAVEPIVVDVPPGGPGAIGDEPLRYSVLDGAMIQAHVPDLYEFYTRLLGWTTEVSGVHTYLGATLESSINVNILPGRGFSYQAHRDSQPYTGLLFLQDLPCEAGGGLEIWISEYEKRVIQPRAGMLIFFDGVALPHRVQEMQWEVARYSVPMNLPDSIRERASGLDAYLYGKPETEDAI